MVEIILKKQEINSGNLILVNAAHPIASEGNRVLVPVDKNNSNILMERCAASALAHIFYDMNNVKTIVPVSGYRSRDEQKQIYADTLRESGRAFTEKYVTFPGCSEHETGYAIDLGLKKDVIDFIRPDFPYDGICGAFRKKAPQYGFIERYQRGKETITGIAHEPWHFRFIGYPHSKIIHDEKISLEEYIEAMKGYRYEDKPLKIVTGNRVIEIFYVSAMASEKLEIRVPEDCPFQVSGNNVDGFIITLWR
jgi:D-alanyl-D-alanine dipeptidase/carboxypeptidase